ncbi:MAG TPA: laccase domain-containing protein, partial [Wenzhouxiangellaceae bacterium]|nr:laccase domain-containing protein [Wenzhouxiangellaceae bacterium]
MNAEDYFISAPFQRPVRGFCTTRFGGVSAPPFDSFNLGAASGDDPNRVAENRRLLRK